MAGVRDESGAGAGMSSLVVRRVLPLLLALALALLAQGCGDAEPASATPTVSPTQGPTPGPATSPTHDEASGALEAVALGHLRRLAEEMGPRDLDSGGERRAAEYLADTFRGLGYSTKLREFPMTLVSLDTSLRVLAPEVREVEAIPLLGSGVGDTTGLLVDAGLARVEDLEGVALQGMVALIQRGGIFFQSKVDNVAAAGAVAAVVYNDRPGPLTGVLARGGAIPAMSIGREEGLALRELLEKGPVEVRVLVETVTVTSQNVIAEKPGDSPRVVIVGGHYDSVPDTQGAADNASGTAAVLALAQELASRSFPFTLRFIGFGGEELGLLGSRRYVDSLGEEELGNIVAMLNLDVVAGAGPLEVAGDRDLAAKLQALDAGLAFRPLPPNITSDHVSFIQAGVPAVILSTPGVSVVHTPRDTMERVQVQPLVQAMELILGYLTALAQAGVE